MAIKTPILAIVGRPNVGKSTLFNRVLGEKRAVVEDYPGVTRDRNYAYVDKYEITFLLVDTGGFEDVPSDDIQTQVVEQAKTAIEEADIVLVIFDGIAGFQPGDEDIVTLLRRYKKPVIYIVNKVDGKEHSAITADFYQLGISDLIPLSALHGRGISDAIARALSELPNYNALVASAVTARQKEKMAAEIEMARNAAYMAEIESEIAKEDGYEPVIEQEREKLVYPDEEFFAPVFFDNDNDQVFREYEKEFAVRQPVKLENTGNLALKLEDQLPEIDVAPLELVKLAIIGRPNVGKSTLLNTLCGEKRALTSPIAGTTRDPLDVTITRDGLKFRIVDTAGLRKQGRISDRVERLSTMRSIHAISDCDVALVLIDAERGPSEQDAKIIGLAHDHGKGILLVVNKWDLLEKDYKSVKKFETQIRDTFKFAPYAPIVFISALTGRRCPKVIEAARFVAEQRTMRISTSNLNRILQKAFKKNQPAFYRGREVKLYFSAQVAVAPPRIALFLNFPKEIHFSYLRYLKNAIREEFKFIGTDIKLSLRKKNAT